MRESVRPTTILPLSGPSHGACPTQCWKTLFLWLARVLSLIYPKVSSLADIAA